MQIELSQKQSDAWHYLTDNDTTEVLYGGGAGGGKSYLGCLWHIDRRMRYPKSRGLIGRASLKSIKESTLITYLKVADLLGLKAGTDYKLNGQDMVVTFSNGSKTIFKDLEFIPSDPNFERLGSTEYTDAFVDEAGETKEKAIDILNSRIRWMLHDFGLVPKLLITANPNHNWIKFKYIKDQDGNRVALKPYQKYVRALVEDNPDEGFKALYKQQLSKMGSQYDIDRLLFGDWDAMPRTGGEFLKQFRRERHVVPVEWSRGDAILLSFDENVNPYITCEVWQVKRRGGKKIYTQIDEICLPDPQNRIHYVCREFSRRYPQHSVPKLFIYGDRTSKKEDTKLEKGENFFTQIQKYLVDYKPVLMLPSSNPSVIDSGAFVDDILAGNVEGLEIEIGENCHKSIHDYSYAKEDSDGTILKKKVKHPDTGVSYEEYSHCFVANTKIKTKEGYKNISDIVIGDEVLTRKGYKKVLTVFDNGYKEVRTYSIGGKIIKCTKDHKFYTCGEFINVSLLMGLVTFCIFDKNKNIWKEKQLFITDLTFIDTLLQKIGVNESITVVILKLTAFIKRLGFMFINTCKKLAISQKGIIYIIWTAISTIMRQTICNVWTQKLIYRVILPKKKGNWLGKTSLKTHTQKLKNGTSQKRVENGIKNTPKIQYLKNIIKPAKVVPLNLRGILFRSIVRKDVQTNIKQEPGEQSLNLQRVYDIEVEGEHEYFANGILVHNCIDAMRYIISYAEQSEYQKNRTGVTNFTPMFARRTPDQSKHY